jgi:hypothetical protein
VANSVEELAYDLATRAIADQERRAADLRSRAGTLLAAASIAGSFLATKSAIGGLDALAVLAVIAYAACVAASIYVLLPHRLVFAFRGSVIAQTASSVHADLREAHQAAAMWIESYVEENRVKLDDLTRWYTAAVIALGVEVLLWTLSIAG